MWTLVRFEMPLIGNKKYVAILRNQNNGSTKRVPFGDRRYQQYRDTIGAYSHLDHLDEVRRRSYRARHAGENRKKFSPGWFAWNYLW